MKHREYMCFYAFYGKEIFLKVSVDFYGGYKKQMPS
jgi:hypothetical protein